MAGRKDNAGLYSGRPSASSRPAAHCCHCSAEATRLLTAFQAAILNENEQAVCMVIGTP